MTSEYQIASITGRLGGYRVISRLGRGASSCVYRGRHELLGFDVAIKVLDPAYAGDGSLRARFLNEARSLTRLSSSYVVAVHDYVEADYELCYCVMELVEGDTLHQVIGDTCGLAAPRAVLLALQLCEALQAAHASGVIHRDVKPENIVVVSGGPEGGPDELSEHAKLIDFGIARLPGELTWTTTLPGSALGTLEYMPPEQLRGGESVAPTADIYALGGVLYAMLTAKVPQPVQSLDDLAQHFDGGGRFPALDLDSVEPSLRPLYELVVRCMAPSLHDRPQCATELAGELRRWLEVNGHHAPAAFDGDEQAASEQQLFSIHDSASHRARVDARSERPRGVERSRLTLALTACAVSALVGSAAPMMAGQSLGALPSTTVSSAHQGAQSLAARARDNAQALREIARVGPPPVKPRARAKSSLVVEREVPVGTRPREVRSVRKRRARRTPAAARSARVDDFDPALTLDPFSPASPPRAPSAR